MVPDPSLMTPAQRRTWDELLAAGSPRPPVDYDVAPRWRAWLNDHLADAAALVPDGDGGLYVSKSALDALDCDGRFLDREEAPFAWSPQTVVGQLAHRAIDLDLTGRRQRSLADLLDYAWSDFATSGDRAGEYVAGLGGVEADDLRAQAVERVLGFRESFPLLPAEWVRTEVACTIRLCDRRIVITGRPDLVIGRPHPRERRVQLVDLKTGGGQARMRHRADMRFYALLATLKHGVAPYRVATYYLDEADWDAEDVDDDMLEAAARTVATKVARAATLAYDRPPEAALRLLAGPACTWCGRAPACPARRAAS